jgi:hypothetical protein
MSKAAALGEKKMLWKLEDAIETWGSGKDLGEAILLLHMQGCYSCHKDAKKPPMPYCFAICIWCCTMYRRW